MSPFEALQLPNGQILTNRIAKAAMEENMADAHQAPSRELKQLYKAWADGEPGLLLTGNVMIDRHAMTGPGGVAWKTNSTCTVFVSGPMLPAPRACTLGAAQPSGSPDHGQSGPASLGALCRCARSGRFFEDVCQAQGHDRARHSRRNQPLCHQRAWPNKPGLPGCRSTQRMAICSASFSRR